MSLFYDLEKLFQVTEKIESMPEGKDFLSVLNLELLAIPFEKQKFILRYFSDEDETLYADKKSAIDELYFRLTYVAGLLWLYKKSISNDKEAGIAGDFLRDVYGSEGMKIGQQSGADAGVKSVPELMDVLINNAPNPTTSQAILEQKLPDVSTNLTMTPLNLVEILKSIKPSARNLPTRRRGVSIPGKIPPEASAEILKQGATALHNLREADHYANPESRINNEKKDSEDAPLGADFFKNQRADQMLKELFMRIDKLSGQENLINPANQKSYLIRPKHDLTLYSVQLGDELDSGIISRQQFFITLWDIVSLYKIKLLKLNSTSKKAKKLDSILSDNVLSAYARKLKDTGFKPVEYGPIEFRETPVRKPSITPAPSPKKDNETNIPQATSTTQTKKKR